MKSLLDKGQKIFLLIWIPIWIYIFANCYIYYEKLIWTPTPTGMFMLPGGIDAIYEPLLFGIFFTILGLICFREEKKEEVK